MSRKKKSESPEVTTEDATPSETAPPHAEDAAPEAQEPAAGTKQFRPVRHTFTSETAGVRAGEDKRFNVPQAFLDFDDDKRATDTEKVELRESGFRYRPADKGYSALANPKTREARDELAQKFTERRLKEKKEQGEGQER